MRCLMMMYQPMPNFAYKAIDPDGQEKTGKLKAISDDAARAKLVERNFYVVEVAPITTQDSTGKGLFRPKKLKAKELTLFTRQLSSLVQVTPLEEALRTIGTQNEKQHVRDRIGSVHAGVVEGQPLSEAMRREPKALKGFWVEE